MATSSFTEFRKLIAARRQALLTERGVVLGLPSSKADMLAFSVQPIVVDAVAKAEETFSGEDNLADIQDEVESTLLAAVPSSDGSNPIGDFMHQILAILGMGLKTDPDLPGGMLASAVSELSVAALDQLQAIRDAFNLLFKVRGLAPGQGRRVLGDDPSLASVQGFLENSIEAGQRLRSTASTQAFINESLLGAVKSGIESSIKQLVPSITPEFLRAKGLLKQLAGLCQTVVDNDARIRDQTLVLTKFRAEFEGRFASVNADLTQSNALLRGLDGIVAQLGAARRTAVDVTDRIPAWARTLATLSAVAKNTSASASKSSFTLEPLASQYAALVADLTALGGESVTELVPTVSDLSAVLLGFNQTAVSQRDILTAKLFALFATAESRTVALVDIIERQDLPESNLLPVLVDLMEQSQLDEPLEALRQGDIGKLMALTDNAMLSTTRVAQELQRAGAVTSTAIGEQLTDAYSLMQDDQQQNVLSTISSEQTRSSSLSLIEAELTLLAHVESLLNQAGGV